MTRPVLPLQDPDLLQQKAMQSVFDCFDEMAEGCLIVDREARVVMINDRYAARLGVDPAKVIGQEIETFIPNSLMRQVVVTGKPILLELFETHGQAFLVIRMPVRDDRGVVVGAVAFALYSHLEALKPLFDRFSQLQAELAQVSLKLAEARRIQVHLHLVPRQQPRRHGGQAPGTAGRPAERAGAPPRRDRHRQGAPGPRHPRRGSPGRASPS